MVAHLSERIANFFIENKIIELEDKEVYEYGLQLLISTILNGLIAFCIAILTHTFLPCCFFLIAFVLLRKSAGGFHANTHLGCCCILCVVLGIFVLFIKCSDIVDYPILSIVSIFFSEVMVYKFAPLEHENKPISSKDKIRLKKLSRISVNLISFTVGVAILFEGYILMIGFSLGMFTSACSMLIALIENQIKPLQSKK